MSGSSTVDVAVLALRHSGSDSVSEGVETLVAPLDPAGQHYEVPVVRATAGKIPSAVQGFLRSILPGNEAASANLQLLIDALATDEGVGDRCSLVLALLPSDRRLDIRAASPIGGKHRFVSMRTLREGLHKLDHASRTNRFVEFAYIWLQERSRNSGGLRRLFSFNEARQKSVSLEHLNKHQNPGQQHQPQHQTQHPQHHQQHSQHPVYAATLPAPSADYPMDGRRFLSPNSASVERLDTSEAALVDIFVPSPWAGDEFAIYEPRVDAFVRNPFAGKQEPRLDRARRLAPTLFPEQELQAHAGGADWLSGLPLHQVVYANEPDSVTRLLRESAFPLGKDPAGWNALHYAAWYGHVGCVQAFVRDGAFPPNLLTDFYGRTALHLAVLSGRYECVLELLRYPDIDHNLTDGFGLTPLELCQRSEENFPTREHQQSTASLLENFQRPNLSSVPVHLVDGSLHLMILPYRDATTVRQLHLRIMGSLGLTDPRDNLFTLWVCSQNLRLQLKPMHKPVQLMRDWRSKTVPLFTSANPMKEDPKLFLRRNALCRLDAEKQGHSDTAETFLFHEARNGYLNGFLPCDQDDMVLISCLLAHAQCTIDGRRVKAFLQSEQNLAGVLPEPSRRVSRLPAGLTSAVAKRYSSSGLRRELEALSLSECHTRFLTVCRRLAVFNSVFFTGQLSTMSGEFSQHRAPRQPIQVFIGVNDIGLHLLGDPSKRFLYSFHYPNFNWSEIAPDTLEVRGTTKSGETTPMRLLSRQVSIICGLLDNLSAQSF
ncbi:hypothetical protein BOX15_Mlig028209g2 [Macrostomum lignano]|uniref:FERM domain-containing protein n=2 Tax=Macrostomum lignano TaxID=282301 RepID=A0A267EA16_9PLAT|nr:hypothetical protein BOX15_Mlig028209g2 [Macrostomum lignano]